MKIKKTWRGIPLYVSILTPERWMCQSIVMKNFSYIFNLFETFRALICHFGDFSFIFSFIQEAS